MKINFNEISEKDAKFYIISTMISAVFSVVMKGIFVFFLWNYINNFVNIPSITVWQGIVIEFFIYLIAFTKFTFKIS